MKSTIWLPIAILVLSLSNPSLSYSFESTEASKTSAFDLNFRKDKKRQFILPPIASYFLPGFDQWVEGQFAYAGAYSGIGLGGLILGMTSDVSKSSNPLGRDGPRLGALGIQLYSTAGSMSTYHSFRTAVRTRQPHGEFLFLKHEESPTDLLLSPLRFSYLARPSTYLGLPANLLGALLIHKAMGYGLFRNNWQVPSASDFFYAGAFSYNAGLGEEALFRGYMMPVTMHYVDHEFASNAITSVIFGAAHYKEGYIPISQTLNGFYLGYLAQKNEWQIGESIFVHTWFDVIAFLLDYATTDSIGKAQAIFRLSPITIPF